MEQWEKDGFASKEAWAQNMVKRAEDAEIRAKDAEDKTKAVEEAVRLEKEQSALATEEQAKVAKEAQEKEATAKLEAEKKLPASEIEAINTKRIASLKEEDRMALEKEYEGGTTEQKALLSTPLGVKAYLEMKHPEGSASKNPFVIRDPELTIEERIAQAFNKNKQQSSPFSSQAEGSGFHLSEEAAKTAANRSKETNDAVRSIRDRYRH